MLVLLLPHSIVDQIDKLFRKFWWGEQERKKKKEGKKLHTMNLKEIGKSINEGGIGIRETRKK